MEPSPAASAFSRAMPPLPAPAPPASMQARSFLPLARKFYLAAIVLILLAFFPISWMPTLLFKLSLASMCLTVSAVLFVLSKRMPGILRAPGRLGMALVGLLPLTYLISYAASTDRAAGLLGAATIQVDSIAFILLGCLAAFLGFALFRTPRAARILIQTILISALIAVLFQYLVIFFGGALPQNIFGDRTVNLVGKWNDLALLSALGALFVLVSAELGAMGNSRRRTLLHWVGAALFLLLLIIVGFSLAWWIILLGSLGILLAKFLARRRNAPGTVQPPSLRPRLSGISALVAVIFLVWGATVGVTLPPSLSVPSLEVRPGLQSTYTLAQAAHAGSALRTLVGAGPGTFVNEWLLHKPAGVNQTQFWNIDFITGFSVFTTAFLSAGVLGALAWLVPLILVLLGLWRIYRRGSLSGEEVALHFSIGLGAAGLWLGAALYAESQGIVLLAFILTGVFLGSAAATGKGERPEAPLSRLASIAGGVCAVGLILLLLILSAVSVRRALALSYEQRAVLALSGGDIAGAAALNANSQNAEKTGDNLRVGVEIDLAALTQLVSASTTPAETPAAQARFQALVSDAISAQGQSAVLLEPSNYQSYVELARVYEFLVPFGVQGAYQSAKLAYQKAMSLNPTNPTLPLLLARLEANKDLKNNLSDIEKLLQQSLTLKNNYTDAFLFAEQLAVAQNDLPTATAAAKSVIASDQGDTPQNLGPLWFQLGLFYYVGNNMTDAVTALQNAVVLIPNYANAKYFLGLAYYNQGRAQDAITEFQALSATNPGNAQVKLILSNLQAGKNPLQGVNPPGNPAAQPKAPIKE